MLPCLRGGGGAYLSRRAVSAAISRGAFGRLDHFVQVAGGGGRVRAAKTLAVILGQLALGLGAVG